MAVGYELLIKDAEVIDGTGKPGFRASVGIRGEKIAAIGDITGDAARIIDGQGLVLSPGFTDPHSHADLNILQYPLVENMVMQGVTTFIGGNCGHCRGPLRGPQYASRWNEYMSLGPADSADAAWKTFGEFLSRVEDTGISLNFVPLAGHGAIRLAVMGEDFKRHATAAEVEEMKSHGREALQNGAFGLSAGMDYEGDFADPDAEVVELLKLVQEHDGIFAPHTRNLDYRWRVDDPEDFGYGRSHGPREDAWVGRYHGVAEAIETAMLANKIRTHIAHLPTVYHIFQPHPDATEEVLARATLNEFIDKPRSQGLDVTFNLGPAEFSVGGRTAVIESFYNSLLNIPEWLRTLPRECLAERLRTRQFRDRLKDYIFCGTFKFGMLPPRTDPYWMDCFRIAECKIKSYEGKTVGQIARERSPHRVMDAVYNQSVEVVFDMLVADSNTTWDFILDKRFGSIVQQIFIGHPAGFPMLDSGSLPAVQPPDTLSKLGPLYWGGFPYYIDWFVKQKGILTLEEAIHKACFQPLQEIVHIKDRGVIREGAYADIILFDFDRIRMTGTYSEPNLPTDGMEYVLVNGTVVYEGKRHTGARPGKVLRRA